MGVFQLAVAVLAASSTISIADEADLPDCPPGYAQLTRGRCIRWSAGGIKPISLSRLQSREDTQRGPQNIIQSPTGIHIQTRSDALSGNSNNIPAGRPKSHRRQQRRKERRISGRRKENMANGRRRQERRFQQHMDGGQYRKGQVAGGEQRWEPLRSGRRRNERRGRLQRVRQILDKHGRLSSQTGMYGQPTRTGTDAKRPGSSSPAANCPIGAALRDGRCPAASRPRTRQQGRRHRQQHHRPQTQPSGTSHGSERRLPRPASQRSRADRRRCLAGYLRRSGGQCHKQRPGQRSRSHPRSSDDPRSQEKQQRIAQLAAQLNRSRCGSGRLAWRDGRCVVQALLRLCPSDSQRLQSGLCVRCRIAAISQSGCPSGCGISRNKCVCCQPDGDEP